MPDSKKTNARNPFIQYDIDKEGVVSLPSTIKHIPACSFEADSDIFVVKLPDALRVIGDRAFSCCSNLWSTRLPDGLEIIGGYAFSSTSITSVVVPKSVKYIGDCAFASSPNIKTVTVMGRPSVGTKAFADLASLHSVYIADPYWNYGTNVFSKKQNAFSKNEEIRYYVAEGSCDPNYAQQKGYTFTSPAVVYDPVPMCSNLFPPKNVLNNMNLSERERKIYGDMELL